MAQLGGAQREPSMEEILASIRRIIEDSDSSHAAPAISETVRPDNDVPVVAEVPVVPQAPAAPEAAVSNAWPPETQAVATVIEVDAFRAELRAAEAKRPVVEGRKPISLAEVQAQVAADQIAARAAAEQAYRDVAVSAVAPADVAGPDMAGNEDALDIVPARSPTPREWNLEMPSTDAVAASKSEVSRRREDMNAVLDDISARQSRRTAVEEGSHAPETAPEPAGLRQSLISDQTGKQVAAAFGELSEAFAARSKKSLDEMAEDMLRPMLQDWLDNNLPLLVERLVREEIERVARGS